MDREQEHCSIEFIRSTMLKHEDIFKHQVRELHRLYQVQKMLMTELRSAEPTINSSSQPSTRNNVKSLSISENTLPSLREMCSCSSDPLRRTKGFDLEQKIERETFESWHKEECNLDLTLSIDFDSEKRKRKQWKHIQKEPSQGVSSNLSRPENGKRPHWVIQALSLN
ncbi:hypothetical protein AXF42_Ash018551 [Apostasia shenzhenica]|uniref:Uncharacterized protein n=1 Tax=Apostasia shenzhenica TaxID=1088818 RepID=A0A2I0AQ29_9ASPA|nr:hypothetical protein AXF42_Ash018551 [Apostasia shenzhenica]